MATKEAVRFGLKNAHYAVWDESTGKYGTPKAWPGAVSLSLSPEGDSSTFYADDKAYYTVNSNGGYTGTLEFATIPEEAETDLLGMVKDASGMIVEDSGAVAASFALLFEVSSNIEPVRFSMFNCTLSRPSIEANTKADSTDVDTTSMDITCIARTFTYGDSTIDAIKGHLALTTETKAKYDAFYNEVLLPTKATA